MHISLAQQIEEVEDEIARRRREAPGQRSGGDEAREKLRRMDAVLETLKTLQQTEGDHGQRDPL